MRREKTRKSPPAKPSETGIAVDSPQGSRAPKTEHERRKRSYEEDPWERWWAGELERLSVRRAAWKKLFGWLLKGALIAGTLFLVGYGLTHP